MRYDFKHLATFVAVAEELNFHRAAERLALAQPAVSRLVSELEERLGVRLLERTTRRVHLTDSGRHMLGEARVILERMNASERIARLLAAGTKATLRIGYTTVTGHSLVPAIAEAFHRENPDLRLELVHLASAAQRDGILEGALDFGFVEGFFQSLEIESRPMASQELLALMRPDHPLAGEDPVSVSELAAVPLVMGQGPEWRALRRTVEQLFQGAGHAMPLAQEASCLSGMLGLVAAGAGVSVFPGVPHFCGTNAVAGRSICTQVHVETHLAWRRKGLNAAMQRFVEACEAVSPNF